MPWHFILDTLARICIVYTFFKSGIKNSLNPQPVIGMIASKNWPYPKAIFVASVVLSFMAPVMIVFHIYAWFGALGLLIFTLLSNLFFCTYWKMDAKSRPMTEFLFDANIAIIGGLILIIAAYL